MSCYHPLLGVGNAVTGKLSVIPYDEKKRDALKAAGARVYDIPCGKCIGCRLDYSRMWANRLMMEAQYHEQSWFVTLTYSDDFLPRKTKVDFPSLNKKHVSKFMKHVRKHFGDGIRFFAAGEYGDNTQRPHYHLILFGLNLDDLKLYKVTSQGNKLYTSDSLNKCWSNHIKGDLYDQIGYVVIAPVTWETCAYTARYVTKKYKGPIAEYYTQRHIEPPFCVMSRNPGIAKNFYIDHPDWEQFDYINVKTSEKGIKFAPPKYFDRLLHLDSPEIWQERRNRKEDIAEMHRDLLDKTLYKSYLASLADKEYNFVNKVKSLDRSEC